MDRRKFLTESFGFLAGGSFLEKTLAGDFDNDFFEKDSDRVLLARMIFGEARGCKDQEKLVVAYTAINRANDGKRWNGETVKEATLKPYQYSCFNKGDPNREKLMQPERHDRKSWGRCLFISNLALENKYPKYNLGVTLYHAKRIKTPSSWDESKITEVRVPAYFKHRFYREK